jgi:hypothetical protein
VILGKTHTTEFACFDPSPARNHSIAHTPGSSSSRLLRSVPAQYRCRLAPKRSRQSNRPATYCGVAAFRPSTQSTCTHGVTPLVPAFDTVGFFGATPQDLLWSWLGFRCPKPHITTIACASLPLELRSRRRSRTPTRFCSRDATDGSYGLTSTGDPRYIAPWTALGGPIVAQPIGHDVNGPPIGMLVAGDPALISLSPALQAHLTFYADCWAYSPPRSKFRARLRIPMNEAVFLHGSRDVRVAPINLREGRPGETLVDVAAVGICGSDLHYYRDGGIGSVIIHEQFVPVPATALVRPASK